MHHPRLLLHMTMMTDVGIGFNAEESVRGLIHVACISLEEMVNMVDLFGESRGDGEDGHVGLFEERDSL